jgi:hypothetical protein
MLPRCPGNCGAQVESAVSQMFPLANEVFRFLAQEIATKFREQDATVSGCENFMAVLRSLFYANEIMRSKLILVVFAGS